MSGNLGTGNTGTSAFANPFVPVGAFAIQNNATSAASTFGFAPKPTAGSSTVGGGTSVFGGSGSASGAAPAAGTSRTSVFGPTAPSTGSAFGGGSSLFGQPKPATAFGANPPDSNPPPVTTGTSALAFSVFRERDPSSPGTVLQYQSITAAPAYKGASLEELHVQDYQQNRTTAGTSGQMSSQPSSLFGTPTTTQQPTTGSIFGGGTTGAFGTTTSQPVTLPFGAFGQQQSTSNARSAFGKPQPQQPVAGTGTSISSGTSAFGQPKPASGSGSTFGQPSPMLDPSKLERIEELLRKSLLGEELVNTQFHLFSARSSPSGRVMKPRVLCANNALLAKSSIYFLDLLSSDINPSDPSLIDLTGDNDVPSNARVDDYGYESDSDLDDCDDPSPVANPEAPKDHSAASPISPSKVSAKTQPKDSNELSEDASESVSSDMFVMGPEQPRTDELFSANKDGAGPVTSCETAVRETVDNERLGNQTAMRLRSLGSRHVLVKDTAFQTWYTLLNYLYTGKFNFLPLSSATPGGRHESSTSSLDGPRCSAKSMYRLASKVGLDNLRDEAFSYIRSNLTEHNILKELSCSLVSKHPQLLELELDMLYSHIASPPVVANFAALAQRIAHKELPHGADIIVGIHTRLLKERHPFSLKPGAPTSLPTFSGPPESVKPDISASNVSEGETKDKIRQCHVDKRGIQSGSLPSGLGVSEPTPSAPSQASANMAVPTATSTEEPNAGGKKIATAKRKGL